MTSSDWLKMVALCLFRAQSESKINQFVTVLGQDQHYFLILAFTLTYTSTLYLKDITHH